MHLARLTFLALIGVLVALLAAPAGTLATDSVTVTGVVVRDGAPVTAVEVVVAVVGTDVIVSTATDEAGAFTVEVEAGIGSELELHATGRTSRSDPDREGCVSSETPIGSAHAVIELLPPTPVTVDLDTLLTSRVCTASGTPRVTPPATDGTASMRAGGVSGGGWLLVIGLLAISGGLVLARSRPRARP